MSKELSKINEMRLKGLEQKIEDGLNIAAKGFLQVGAALVEARQAIDNDVEFGKWRTENTSIKSNRTASAYMQVFSRFGKSALTGKVSYSVLQELVSAPESTVEKIEAIVEDGDTVTVKETRELVKNEKAESKDEETGPSGQEEAREGELLRDGERTEGTREVKTAAEKIAEAEAKAPPPPREPQIPGWLEEENRILGLPEDERILAATKPAHAFGFSAFSENPPTVNTLNRLLESYVKTYVGTKQEQRISQAYEYLIDGDFDG